MDLTKKLTCLFLYLCICSTSVLGERKDIHDMMYETFKNAAVCFRILNGTNQFGCSTPRSGTTGVVHFVNNDADIQWLLETSKTGPYMAVIPPKLFVRNVMLKLTSSPKVSGVLLGFNGTDDRPSTMSPDDTCPNRYSSLSGSCDDSSPWNPQGSGFLLIDWKVPLYVVKDSAVIQQIYDCFLKFNRPLDDSQLERPLCSLQMTGPMYAAVDTPTCLRRSSLVNSFSPISYCDPMGDQNLVYHLLPRKPYSSAPNGSIVLVTARLDVAALFDGLAPGAMATVSGIVTLITTAHLLSQLLPKYKETYTKNVVFILLNGEAQDYIGSSRVLYDMKQGKFPVSNLPINLEHLDQVIDLHQLDATRKIYSHCFKSTTAQNTLDMLTNLSKKFNVSIEGSCSSSTKLPPSSLHSFLKNNMSLPGIILTNHASSYSNMYYSGLLDDSMNLHYKYANGSRAPPDGIQSSLADIAQSLALSLAQIVDNSVTWPTNITTESTASLVDELLYCYLESRQCEMFRNVSGDSIVGEGPLPLYVGVNRSPNQITMLTFLTLAQLTGKPTNATEEQCNNPRDSSKVDWHSYVWISGGKPGSGVCMETRINFTPAVSPAFSIENYNWTSAEYSSWTESVWPELSLRMFLRPSFNQEVKAFVSGIIVLFLSFASVYWVNRNVDRLFNPLVSSELESQKDTAFLLKEVNPSVTYGGCDHC